LGSKKEPCKLSLGFYFASSCKIFVKKIMENLIDYSTYVIAAYAFTGAALGGLMIFVLTRYFLLRKKFQFLNK
jgi:hypothetical protein